MVIQVISLRDCVHILRGQTLHLLVIQAVDPTLGEA